jgi:peptidyl-tRNA hydrolase, PTH1 family
MNAAFRRIFGATRSHTNAQGAPAKLVVGLGNPGTGYSHNRHNVGFMSIAYLAKTHGMRFDRTKGDARVAEGNIDSTVVMLARPQTFMNASGRAVSALLKKLDLAPDDLIVIHDDLDLALGRIRLRKGGSSGGHKGVQSIIDNIASADFTRVRIGVGRPVAAGRVEEREKGVVDYVLSNFTDDERLVIDRQIPRIAEAVECLIADGLVAAMNRFNVPPGEKPAQPDQTG